MGLSVFDFINQTIERSNRDVITLEDFTYIRNNGTEEEIAEAVQRMMEAGGYDNLA